MTHQALPPASTTTCHMISAWSLILTTVTTQVFGTPPVRLRVSGLDVIILLTTCLAVSRRNFLLQTAFTPQAPFYNNYPSRISQQRKEGQDQSCRKSRQSSFRHAWPTWTKTKRHTRKYLHTYECHVFACLHNMYLRQNLMGYQSSLL